MSGHDHLLVLNLYYKFIVDNYLPIVKELNRMERRVDPRFLAGNIILKESITEIAFFYYFFECVQ